MVAAAIFGFSLHEDYPLHNYMGDWKLRMWITFESGSFSSDFVISCVIKFLSQLSHVFPFEKVNDEDTLLLHLGLSLALSRGVSVRAVSWAPIVGPFQIEHWQLLSSLLVWEAGVSSFAITRVYLFQRVLVHSGMRRHLKLSCKPFYGESENV